MSVNPTPGDDIRLGGQELRELLAEKLLVLKAAKELASQIATSHFCVGGPEEDCYCAVEISKAISKKFEEVEENFKGTYKTTDLEEKNPAVEFQDSWEGQSQCGKRHCQCSEGGTPTEPPNAT